MKNKNLISMAIISILVISAIPVNAGRVIIDVNALELTAYQEEWDENDKLYFEIEGLNITIENKLLSVIMAFEETMGRDVTLNFHIPNEFMPPSTLGLIESRGENTTVITWRTTHNQSILSFDIDAFQMVELEISKSSLFYGGLKKKVHAFWNYVEYNGDSDGTMERVTVFIEKSEPDFEIDNKHMIVQYKTQFFGWYYPIDEVTSEQIHYHVEDLGRHYKVVTTFKNGTSGDIKIHAFRGASEGIFNWDAVKGTISKAFLKAQIGIKRAIINWFGDKDPNYE